jgi:LPXTG-motif cell wall-anchored protein
MKTKSIVIVGLALLAGGIFLLVNRSEKPANQPQPAVAASNAKTETLAPKKSYGGSFRIKSVTIAETKQPTVQPN